MKKSEPKGYSLKREFLVIMKIYFVLVCISLAKLSASNLAAQTITLNAEDTELKDIFDKIESKSSYHFFYNNSLVNVFQKTSINVEDSQIHEILSILLSKTDISYRVFDDQIVLFPRNDSSILNFFKALEAKKIKGGISDTMITSMITKVPQNSISGTVSDEDGLPLAGVSIAIEGTTRGTQTDFDGNFEILANGGEVLIFSYIGMETQKITLGPQQVIDVVLRANSTALEEVVLIGYGTQKKSEVTGSISNVSGDEVASMPVQSFESALGGRATGVNIIANAGVLNQAPVFRIRGTNSLSLSSYPLIVVDGVPMFTSDDDSVIGYASTNPLSSINPADIESIDIAKDAAATSIYGSRAANGVVFITTKKGRKGAAKVTYENWVGFTNANNLPDVLNAAQYIEIKNEGLLNEGTFDPVSNYYGYSLDNQGRPIDTDWSDHVYRSGVSHSHNLNISGASESTNYYASVGYTDQEGIFKATTFDRKTILFNVENQTTDWLRVGAKVTLVNENNASAMSTGAAGSETSTGAMARLALMTAPIAAAFNNDGSYNNTASGFVGLQDNFGHLNQSRLGFTNPELSMRYNYSNNTVDHVQSNVFVNLKPAPWLSVMSQYSIDNRQTNYDIYFSPLTNEGRSSGGTARSVNSNRDKWIWTNTLTIQKDIADAHSINFLLGQEQQKTDGDRFGLQRTGQTDPLYSNIQGGWQNVSDYSTDNNVYDNYLFSLFSRLQYNYLSKYFFTANVRQDEYSALGLNNKKGTFWGLSAGWELMKEGFWSGAGLDKVFSNFKLRASYGKVGNIGGLGDFAALNTYSATLNGGQPGLVYSATGNPDLEWETSKKTDIGLNFGILNNRISGEVSYYKNKIDGLIFAVPLPPSVGIPNGTNNSILQNVGSMENSGLEFSLSGLPIMKKDFSWNTAINLSTNKNVVTSLADGVPSIITGYSITLPGYPVGMINAVRTDGIDPATGRRIFLDIDGNRVYYQHVVGPDAPAPHRWAYEDGSEAPAITPAADAVPFENTAPKVFGGFNNTFTYKGLQLDVLLTYQLGGHLYNGTYATMTDQRFWNNSTDVLRRWQQPGDRTDVARIVNGDNVSMGNTMAIDANISSSDFMRLKNVMLTYNFPEDLISSLDLSNLSVYISGQNLALWTKYTGMDPEVTTNSNTAMTQGIDRNQAPNARTITLGMRVSF